MSDEVRIRVAAPSVPTTASPFHSSATHVDALGMPVAFYSDPDIYDEPGWPYHPTPCHGAAVSIFSDTGVFYCKACYEEVDPAYGNHPLEPYRPIEKEES